MNQNVVVLAEITNAQKVGNLVVFYVIVKKTGTTSGISKILSRSVRNGKKMGNKINIYTDGSCSKNPGPGGWATLIIYESKVTCLSGYEVESTNNRMELIAVVEALKEIIKRCNKYRAFEIFSDSAYVVNSFKNGWMYNWRSNGWKTKSGKDVKNVDLWKQSIKLLGLINNKNPDCEIIFTKIKGHSGITYNEVVDRIAKEETLKALKEKEENK